MNEPHIKTAKAFEIKSKSELRGWIGKNLIVKGKPIIKAKLDKNSKIKDENPILVRSNLYSVFDALLNNAETNDKLCGFSDSISPEDKQQKRKSVIKNIEKIRDLVLKDIDFLLNSSIWIRFCDNGDWDGTLTTTDKQTESIQWALKEFDWFQKMGLYRFKPAQEYIEYQIRVQKENYLKEMGHGKLVTPLRYSNEVVFRDFFLNNEKNDKKSLGVHFLPNVSENNDFKNFKTKDVGLRILMLDDKIGKPEDGKKVQSCSGGCFDLKKNKEAHAGPLECGKDCNLCKLRIVRELISGGFISDIDSYPDDENKKIKDTFQERTYWTEEVDAFSVDSIKLSDVWAVLNEEENGKIIRKTEGTVKDLSKSLENQGQAHIQIIGVRDLESAIALMSCCKFDIILLDYLLGERGEKDPERTFSTELFDFLNYEFNGNRKTEAEQTEEESEQKPPILELLGQSFNQEQIQQLQGIIRSKRGPIGKFWFIPMTSYNASFITDLQKNNIRLIDYRWNISQGADPINTPWQFLNKITNFIDLQLQLCVYTMEDLLRFIKGTCEGAEELDKGHEKDSGKKLDFYEFQSYMGAEYVSFMRRYGNRHLILRDAVCDKNSSGEANMDKSVFATYVWNEFYNKPEYRDVIELNRLLQRFLQHVSSMHNDQFGRQRMIEAFGQLCFFIETNKKVQDCIDNHRELIKSADSCDNPKFSDYLGKLHQLMEKLTSSRDGLRSEKDNENND